MGARSQRSVAPSANKNKSNFARMWASSGQSVHMVDGDGDGEGEMFSQNAHDAGKGLVNMMRKKKKQKITRQEYANRQAKRQVLESQVALLESDLRHASAALRAAREAESSGAPGVDHSAVEQDLMFALKAVRSELRQAKERVARFLGKERHAARVSAGDATEPATSDGDGEEDGEETSEGLEVKLESELRSLKEQLAGAKAMSEETGKQLQSQDFVAGELSVLKQHWHAKAAERREQRARTQERVKQRGTMWERTQRYHEEKEQRIQKLRQKREDVFEEECTFRPTRSGMTIEELIARKKWEEQHGEEGQEGQEGEERAYKLEHEYEEDDPAMLQEGM